MIKRMFGVLSAAAIAAASVPAAGASGLWKESESGIYLCREFISEENQGTYKFTPDENGCFTVEWDGVDNYAAEMCPKFSESVAWSRFSSIEQTYEAELELRGNVLFGMHGCLENAHAEFYVVEGWGSWRPPGGRGQQGVITADGAVYDCYCYERTNQPGIEGVQSYNELWSVRQSSKTRNNRTNNISGTISLGEHFKQWARFGMLDERQCVETCGLYVEAYGGGAGDAAGSLKVLRNKIINVPVPTPTVTTTTPEPAAKQAADKNGVFFRSEFEDSTDGWTPRQFSNDNWTDESKLEPDGRYYAENGHSLAVSGRTSSWEGASRSIDGYALEPGKEYQVQAAVMQNSQSVETFKLVLTYTDSFGSEQFETLKEQTCKKGEWTVLTGTFRMPETPKASSGDPHETIVAPHDFSIYAETGSTPCDYWLDCVTLAEKDAAVQISLSKSVPASVQNGTKTVQYPNRDDSEPYRAHQNKNYSYIGGGTGFKDVLGPYFRVGATVSAYALNDESIREFYLKNFNSVTCENEMKPELILKSINGADVTVDLKNADSILRFAEENGIGVRGHNFVWYSQTPNAMFQGTKEESDARIESFIRQTFTQLKENYPALDLYAYDVANEVFKNDGGGLRVKNGGGNDTSQWTNIYGEDNPEFIINAFQYARKYAPVNCKLYLSEYNEYIPEKCDDVCGLAKQIMKEGDYIDGIGMQSHLDANYPDKTLYESAFKKYAALGLDIQITEMDITNSQGAGEMQQRRLWSDIFRIALTYADHISSVTLWHPLPGGWRSMTENNYSLFKSNMEPLPAYYDVLDLTDEIAPPVTTEMPIVKPEKPAGYAPLGSETAPAGNLRGDVNCDDSVDVADVVLLLRYAIADEEAKITDQGVLNGDADGNGQTDTDDASLILKFIAKKIQL